MFNLWGNELGCLLKFSRLWELAIKSYFSKHHKSVLFLFVTTVDRNPPELFNCCWQAHGAPWGKNWAPRPDKEKPDKPHFDLNANVGDQWCSSKRFIKCGNIFSYHSSGGGVLLVCDGVDDIHPEMHRQPHPSTKKNHLALKVNPAIAEKPCVCENLM